MFKIFLFEKELQLEVAVGRMDPERREKMLALTNTHTEDGSGPLCEIMRTNMCALFPFCVFADRSVHLPSLFSFLGLPRLCLPPAPSQNDLALP